MKYSLRKFGIALMLLCSSVAWAEDGKWQLEKDDEGIRVYTRDVKGSDLKEFRGVTRMKSTLTAPIALIEDAKMAPKWMHNCGAVEIIERLAPGEAISYVVTEAPWPVSDRDSIVHSKATQDESTGAVRVDVTIRNDVFPENDDYVRITKMSGHWSFTPSQQAGYLDVEYQVHAEPGGGLPSWLSNSVVVDIPFNTLSKMKKMLKKDKYQQAELDFIVNR